MFLFWQFASTGMFVNSAGSIRMAPAGSELPVRSGRFLKLPFKLFSKAFQSAAMSKWAFNCNTAIVCSN